MPEVDRIGERLRHVDARGERLLVVYLTVGDPLTTTDLAVAAADAGADVLELGVPTPSTSPRGAEIARSFDRARECGPERAWDLVRALRARLPDVPLVPLVYPWTVADLGRRGLLAACHESDVDGLVLTEPDAALPAAAVAAESLSAIPLIRPGTDPADRRRLEDIARHLTYHPLAARTGDPLDRSTASRATEAAAGTGRPFLAGFGIRDEHDIRAVVPHAAGVVLGSELYRGLATVAPPAREAWTRTTVRRWKAATTLAA